MSGNEKTQDFMIALHRIRKYGTLYITNCPECVQTTQIIKLIESLSCHLEDIKDWDEMIKVEAGWWVDKTGEIE